MRLSPTITNAMNLYHVIITYIIIKIIKLNNYKKKKKKKY